MAALAIIDALFCIPKDARITQVSDCISFSQDISSQMTSDGISGAVLAPCLCRQCQNQWNCADRKTQEVADAASRNPKQLRGLASYDPLRIGDSLRWIDDAVSAGTLVGAYAQAESCVSGLDAARMYPLYGLCARLRMPMVLEFNNRDQWQHHRPEVEVVSADFPELDILLAPPSHTDPESMIRILERFPRVAFLLNPKDLVDDARLCEFVELQGQSRVAFRSLPQTWAASVETAAGVPLRSEAKHAFLFENAARFFGFPVPQPF